MKGGVYVARSNEIERKYYVDSDDLAQEIFEFLAFRGPVVTLATDYKWWAKQLVTPYIGYVTNVSLGYSGNFSKEDLLISLFKKGLSITPHSKCNNFYYVRYK